MKKSLRENFIQKNTNTMGVKGMGVFGIVIYLISLDDNNCGRPKGG
jgi:hypothetical protein